MAKIIGLAISLILVSSCTGQNQFDRGKHNLMFMYNPWITINFNTKVLEINYGDLKYTDTLHLSKADELAIINSFSRNRINEVKGEMLYADEYRTMPPSDFKIKLFVKGKLQSEMTVDFDYRIERYLIFGQKYRVVCFRNDVLKVLNKSNELKRALDVFTKYDSNLWKRNMKK